jgi:hypothetical protein
MPLSAPSLRRFVRRALVDATGATRPDRTQLASAFDTLCARLRRQLQTVFGISAVDALFARALHVAAVDFPWLRELVRNGADPCAGERVASVERFKTDTLEEGLAAVLAHNISLLSAFVGEDLVLPLVQQAWGVSDASGSEGDQ